MVGAVRHASAGVGYVRDTGHVSWCSSVDEDHVPIPPSSPPLSRQWRPAPLGDADRAHQSRASQKSPGRSGAGRQLVANASYTDGPRSQRASGRAVGRIISPHRGNRGAACRWRRRRRERDFMRPPTQKHKQGWRGSDGDARMERNGTEWASSAPGPPPIHLISSNPRRPLQRTHGAPRSWLGSASATNLGEGAAWHWQGRCPGPVLSLF